MRHVDVVHRIGADGGVAVLDQVPKALIEVRGARGHAAARNGVLEPRLPAEGMLGCESRIPPHEAGGEVLIETRLFESGPYGHDGPRALVEPEGQSGSVGGIGAEALVVIEPGADGEVGGPRSEEHTSELQSPM